MVKGVKSLSLGKMMGRFKDRTSKSTKPEAVTAPLQIEAVADLKVTMSLYKPIRPDISTNLTKVSTENCFPTTTP